MNKVIYDLGMNNGDDTEYYLLKGFKVVAIEANPVLCTYAKTRFQDYVDKNQLCILNYAISNTQKKIKFYLNLDNSHWSSLNKIWARRNNSNIKEIYVQGMNLTNLVSEFGNPHYIKIDIEGADKIALLQIADLKNKPQFLSVEDCYLGFEYLNLLTEIGYKKFKLINQANVPNEIDREINYNFRLGSSGKFGEETSGNWINSSEINDFYSLNIRCKETKVRKTDPSNWWDIHCSL